MVITLTSVFSQLNLLLHYIPNVLCSVIKMVPKTKYCSLVLIIAILLMVAFEEASGLQISLSLLYIHVTICRASTLFSFLTVLSFCLIACSNVQECLHTKETSTTKLTKSRKVRFTPHPFLNFLQQM